MKSRVLISGAGSGLGQSLALRYAKAGYEVCVADIDADAGKTVVDLINNGSGCAFYIGCDITQQADVEKLSSMLDERWGALDVLINNAGVASAGYLDAESMEQWQWVIHINLLGHVRMTKAMLPLIRKSAFEDKAIINVASQAGLTPIPGMASYSATKAAMVSYSETAYLELCHEGIHVAVACPSFFNTNLTRSLRSDEPHMKKVMSKLVDDSEISADKIAGRIFSAVNKRKFMIITHKEGRNAWVMKRFLSPERFLKMMSKRTKGMLRRKVKAEHV